MSYVLKAVHFYEDAMPKPDMYSNTEYYGGALAGNGYVYTTPLSVDTTGCLYKINPSTGECTPFAFGEYSGCFASFTGPNGKVYSPSLYTGAGGVTLVIDPSDDSATWIGTSIDIYAENPESAVLAANGKIYAPPYTGSQILVVDTNTDTNYGIGTFGDLTYKWSGSVLAPNGMIYCPPYDSGSLLKIDPSTDTFSTIGSFPIGEELYKTAVVAENGKVYAMPKYANNVLCIDPATDSMHTFGNFEELYSDYYLNMYYRFERWIPASNGKIYGIPYKASKVVCIDTNVETISFIGDDYGTAYEWRSGAIGPDGKIYCVPYTTSTDVMCIDPATDTTSIIYTFPHTSGSYYSFFYGAVMAGDTMVFVPSKFPHLFTIEFEQVPETPDPGVYIKVNGTYVPASNMYIKINDIWV